jgi:hypothetical protein
MRPGVVVIGRVQYRDGVLQATMDYSCQSNAATIWNAETVALKVYAHPDSTENTKIVVKPGRAWINQTFSTLATETASGAISATTTNGRIDLITLGTDGVNACTVNVVFGTAAVSPVAPACPPNEIPLAYIERAGSRVDVTCDDIKQITVNQAIYNPLPVGTILMYDGVSWVNDSTLKGWFMCNGAANTYGTAPDLRNKFIMGTDASTGATGGANSYTLTEAQLAAHYHSVPQHGHTLNGANHTHSISAAGGATATATASSHYHFLFAAAADGYDLITYPTGHANVKWESGGEYKYSMRESGGVNPTCGKSEYASAYSITLLNNTATPSISMSVSDKALFNSNSTGSTAAIENRPSYYTAIYIKRMA